MTLKLKDLDRAAEAAKNMDNHAAALMLEQAALAAEAVEVTGVLRLAAAKIRRGLPRLAWVDLRSNEAARKEVPVAVWLFLGGVAVVAKDAADVERLAKNA